MTIQHAVMVSATAEDYPYPPSSVDRLGWLSGEWDGEVDKHAWRDLETEYSCAIIRHSTSGHLCGYVKVPQEHSLSSCGYRDLPPEAEVEPHGGVTYGEGDGWFGFDCAHAWDFQPGIAALLKSIGAPPRPLQGDKVYKNISFVKRQCARLARQLWEYEHLKQAR